MTSRSLVILAQVPWLRESLNHVDLISRKNLYLSDLSGLEESGWLKHGQELKAGSYVSADNVFNSSTRTDTKWKSYRRKVSLKIVCT